MTTGATGQLGLALPVQGELSGTWGDTVNNGITQYTNIAIAATLTLTNDGAVTLANTTGDATASNITSSLTGAGTVTAQFAIVRVTGTLTTAKVVTAPSYSKTYTVVNAATGGIVTFKASGQTGVSIAVGESAFVYYNGTDYVKLAGTVDTGVTSFQTSLSGLTPSTATTGAVTLAGTLATTNGGTGLTSFTSGGVVYASSSSALATGSALQFDGTNLGVGVTPSAWNSAFRALEIKNTAGFLCDGDTAFVTNNAYFNTSSSWIYKTTDFASRYQQQFGKHTWFNAPSGTAGNAITFTQAMTLDASGQLLLGTTSNLATSRRELVMVGTGGAMISLGNSSIADRFQIVSDSGENALLINKANTPMIFYTNNTQRARITETGGFSVGTTSDPGAGAIYATGNITAFFSDKRLKTVSGKIENALDKVAKLSGVYYTFNDTAKSFGYDSDEEHVGVIAQEVEAVLPQVVKAAPFDLDENNNSKSGENYKTVQYDKLVPLLIEAINELQAKVKALEAK
jgi:hypothetical protein